MSHSAAPLSRPLTILDLPTETLDIIFDSIWEHAGFKNGYFNTWPFLDDVGKVNWQAIRHRLVKGRGLRSIQNLRLVCRRFNRIASPTLFPVVFLDITKESLDRLDAISRNPAIADGVRGVQLSLRYYLPELANSFEVFKKRCIRALDKMGRDIDYSAEAFYYAGVSGLGDSQDDNDCRVFMDVMADYRIIKLAWNAMVDDPLAPRATTNDIVAQASRGPGTYNAPDGYTPTISVQVTEHHELLLRAFAQYKLAYREQSRLLSEGIFAKATAAAMARMSQAVCLSFVDDSTPEKYVASDVEWAKSALDMNGSYPQLLTAPAQWSEVESMTLKSGIELLPVRVLSDLPVALHLAGAPLRELSLGCFPQESNFHLLRPSESLCGDMDPWAALALACAGLESFHFGRGGGDNLHSLGVRKEHISGDDKTNVDSYLGAMLSGQRLEDVDLSMRPFSLNRGREYSNDWLDVSLMLGHPRWSGLQRIHFSHVKVDRGSLMAIAEGLGHSLRQLTMYNIELTGRDWLPITDVLRAKVIASGISGDKGVTIKLYGHVKGGELGLPAPEPYEPWHGVMAFQRREEKPNPVLEQLQHYILGVGSDVNPLLGMRESN
ncbi:hypothetical protein ACHAQH_006724 [Verticillium albo-atrum]